jgi:hypothetical protein
MTKVYQLSEAFLLNYTAPNYTVIQEILQFDAALFDSISNEKLSQYIFALGQFIISVKYQENLKNTEYIINRKSFEHLLNKKRFEYADDIHSAKTEKEKQAWLLEKDESLQQLSYDMLVSEAEKTTLNDMTKAYEGLLNALKKEISSRFPE